MLSASFQVASLVSIFVAWLVCWSYLQTFRPISDLACLRVTVSFFIAYSGKEEPNESCQFQGLPELFRVVYLPVQIASLRDELFQYWRQLLHNTNN